MPKRSTIPTVRFVPEITCLILGALTRGSHFSKGPRTLRLSRSAVVIDLKLQLLRSFEFHAFRYELICCNTNRVMERQAWPPVAVGCCIPL